MSNLGDTLATNNNVQGAGRTILEIWGAAVSAIADAAGVGAGIGVIDSIIGVLDPPAGSSQPSLQDLINKFDQFTTLVATELNQIDKTIAGGQVQTWAHDLQQVLQGPEGPLSVIPEITDWKNNPGLPLPDKGFDPSPSDCHIWARSVLNQLIGEAGGQPGVTAPPTPFWFIPPGDLPLFQPDNPWTYLGTIHMFNQLWEIPIEAGGPSLDNNPYTGGHPGAIGKDPPVPQFDLSALNFTNDFSPTPVTGVPPNNALNPTWILQQSMAAVGYYFILCGAVLKNFPNDGATAHDFVGTGPTDPNFLRGLSWYHDQIRAGIVCIAPPFPWDLVPAPAPVPADGVHVGDLIPASADAGISTWSVPCVLNIGQVETSPYFERGVNRLDAAAVANAPASLWKRPFGALCNYTGFVAGYGGPQPSVDSYPDYVYPTPGQPVYLPAQPTPGGGLLPSPTPASRQWYTGFYSKYLVACLWRAKLVYNGMGLGDMWRTINNLYAMFGQPPRPGPCFGDWSLREVFRMLGSADWDSFPLPVQLQFITETPTGPILGNKFTVRAFLQFMNGAAPTPRAPLNSLRAALQA